MRIENWELRIGQMNSSILNSQFSSEGKLNFRGSDQVHFASLQPYSHWWNRDMYQRLTT
jgi:hypothetical protein